MGQERDIVVGILGQASIVRHVVERVTIENGEVRDIRIRLEAQSFSADTEGGLAVAPPDGLEPSTPTQRP